MKKIDKAIEYVEDNMTMLNSICTKEELEDNITDYILNILKLHKSIFSENH